MPGICIARITPNQKDPVGGMLSRLDTGEGVIWSNGPENGLSMGWAGRPWQRDGAIFQDQSLLVLVDGEIFGDRQREIDPAGKIAKIYRRGAIEEIQKLNGSFAVIIRDRQADKIVLLADRLGTRPLFFWSQAGEFAASSRLSSLLSDERVPRRISRQGVLELVSYLRVFGDHTQYDDVVSLPGGEIVVIEQGVVKRTQGTKLSWKPGSFTLEEGAEVLATALKKATLRRIGENEKVGLLMSGGLDARAVLGCAANQNLSLPCITATASDNNELRVARLCAEAAGQPFHHLPVNPKGFADIFDEAVIASDALYSAPINLYGFMPGLAEQYDALLSGHGLDYTLRGMYLPKQLLKIAGSRTVLPRLQNIGNVTAEKLAAIQYVATPPSSVKRVLSKAANADLQAHQVAAMAAVLERVDVDNPYDAWDAYILHHQANHYANSDFIAAENFLAQRNIAFDHDVLEAYLAIKPEWRASGRLAQQAFKQIFSPLMALPNANTDCRADWPFSWQVSYVLGRAVLRRLKLAKRPMVQNGLLTDGSWINGSQLLRVDENLVKRLQNLKKSEALIDTGLFDANGIKATVDEHIEGRENHQKILYMSLTLESWFRRFG